MEKLFTMSEENLQEYLYKKLKEIGYTNIENEKTYLYAEGNGEHMLVAHLDTVHKELPEIIMYSKDERYMMSPQGIGGDDRCGVYIILEILKNINELPYIVFTRGEEVGGIGAGDFCKNHSNIPNIRYIVEFDRKGDDDCVFYDCDNREFVNFVEQFGFKEQYGSFTDISEIAPHLGIAAVNISCGYHNPHTNYEYVDINMMKTIIEKSTNMLLSDSKTFEYVKAKHKSFYSYFQHGAYTYGDHNNGTYNDSIQEWPFSDPDYGYCDKCGFDLLTYGYLYDIGSDKWGCVCKKCGKYSEIKKSH